MDVWRVLVRRALDQAMRTLAGILIHAFFRTVEVENADDLPTRAPTVVVAIHRNGLVDGLLLMTALKRYPRFSGKSTLFRIQPLWPFLKLAGVVPVHRASDGPTSSHKASAFGVSRRILSDGGMLEVFPESISRDAPGLQTLRTGAARIALEASIDDAVGDLTLLALGISYDAKARFRSRAVVRVGQPLSVTEWAALVHQDRPQAVRAMTDDMAERLRALEPNYRSWAEAADLVLVAEILIRPLGSLVPSVVNLGRRGAAQNLGGGGESAGSQSPVGVVARSLSRPRSRCSGALPGLSRSTPSSPRRSGGASGDSWEWRRLGPVRQTGTWRFSSLSVCSAPEAWSKWSNSRKDAEQLWPRSWTGGPRW